MAHHPGMAPVSMTFRKRFAFIFLFFFFLPGSNCLKAALDSPLAQDSGLSISRQPETLLLRALESLVDQQLDQAQVFIEQVVEQNPDFRLAHLVHADILAARAGKFTDLGAGLVPEAKLVGLEDEARRRWRHHLLQPGREQIPSNLVRIGENQPYVLVVDLDLSRMYVFANNVHPPRLVDDYYVSGGKLGPVKHREGDLRTPVGVYYIQGHIPGRDLPHYFGWGAFPLDYPNAWDRRLGRTGFGIWLHGNPTGVFSRPPQASEGCVTMHNEDLSKLAPLLKSGRIPMVITRSVEWANPEDLQQFNAEMSSRLEQWRRDWESRDIQAYLRHYSRDFHTGDKDYEAWVKHKQRVIAGKREIRVGLHNISIFQYPLEQGLVLAVFDQDYWSNNFQSKSLKHQYWRQEKDGQWRIIYEGTY